MYSSWGKPAKALAGATSKAAGHADAAEFYNTLGKGYRPSMRHAKEHAAYAKHFTKRAEQINTGMKSGDRHVNRKHVTGLAAGGAAAGVGAHHFTNAHNKAVS